MAVLDPMAPLADIACAIGPSHLSVSMSLVLFVLTFEHVAAGPGESAEAMLSIVEILSLVLVDATLLPGGPTAPAPFALLKTLVKLADVV